MQLPRNLSRSTNMRRNRVRSWRLSRHHDSLLVLRWSWVSWLQSRRWQRSACCTINSYWVHLLYIVAWSDWLFFDVSVFMIMSANPGSLENWQLNWQVLMYVVFWSLLKCMGEVVSLMKSYKLSGVGGNAMLRMANNADDTCHLISIMALLA